MKNARWIASAIVLALALPVFAQEKKEQPKEPAKPAAQAPAKEPVKEPAKPGEPAKPTATTTTTTATTTTTTVAAIGKPAPDFKLTDTDGKPRSLSEFKGKIVVLEWANAGCPVCQRHAKAKTSEKTMKGLKDVVWINIDSTADAKLDDVKKFAKDNGMAIYLVDPSGTTGKAYGAKTTPHMFVIDTKGNLAYMGAIDDDKDGSKGEKAKNYVKEAVDAIQKGTTVATATTEPYGCTVKYKG